MKQAFDSTKWVGYAAALIVIVLAAVAVFLTTGRGRGPHALPPIKDVRIEPGFVGQQPFGLWTLVCENPKQPAPPADGTPAPAMPKRLCRTNARMMVRVPDSQTPLLAAAFNVVMIDTQPVPGLMFRVPPGARAAASVDFFIDRNNLFKAPLRCARDACFAQGASPPAVIEQMRAGRTLSLIYTIKDRERKDRKVRVDQPLHGFRQAYDAMLRAMAA